MRIDGVAIGFEYGYPLKIKVVVSFSVKSSCYKKICNFIYMFIIYFINIFQSDMNWKLYTDNNIK